MVEPIFEDMSIFNLILEFQTKERLVKELKDAMAEHAKLQLSIREKNDIMHKKRHPVRYLP